MWWAVFTKAFLRLCTSSLCISSLCPPLPAKLGARPAVMVGKMSPRFHLRVFWGNVCLHPASTEGHLGRFQVLRWWSGASRGRIGKSSGWGGF